MSRKSVPRFCDNDMRKNKDLKCWSESERLRRVLGHDAEKCERFSDDIMLSFFDVASKPALHHVIKETFHEDHLARPFRLPHRDIKGEDPARPIPQL
ncbi:hypothetical protein ELI25_09405 [Rhizobium ruizarguesonis]|nr:hypothetical protein ELI25_09405 [Rhizobium ruizarguesonis]TAZ51552.1 hypothetical protein ELH76_10435 [Rhizobium ruizarguesonis]